MKGETSDIDSLNLDSLPVGVCTIQEDYSIIFWNKTIEIWTGMAAEEVIGNTLEKIVPQFASPLEKSRLKVVFEGGGPVILSSRFHPRIFPLRDETQPEGRFQRITITPCNLPGGEQQAIIAVEDVTAITEQVLRYRTIKEQIAYELEERKKTENALAMAISKLNTLASITRHDLFNTLTVFEGYLMMLSRDLTDIKFQQYIDRMKEAAGIMKRHIAFARDYQEMGSVLPTWFQVENLVKTSAIGPVFSGITFHIKAGNLEVLADPLIVKAIYNLLENAVRHGEHTTSITVTSTPVPDGITIVIEDDGKGIPAGVKNRIFNKGFGSNTGLGLFLTREILGITGMQIIETGVEGKGARFEIRVPSGGRNGNGGTITMVSAGNAALGV